MPTAQKTTQAGAGDPEDPGHRRVTGGTVMEKVVGVPVDMQ